VRSQESEQSHICVLGISILPISMIFLVNFGTVPTMCYLFFNLFKEYLTFFNRFYDITWFGAVCSSIVINTHYIHSVVVQYFVSGRASCVNQYHYQSRKRRVVMRFVHTTGKTWYTVLYQHTMYVISLSNISINTKFKQITRVEIRFTNVYNTLGETTFCAWRHVIVAFHSFDLLTLLTLTCFPRIPMNWRHDTIVLQRRSRVTSGHSFITTVWWYNILYHTPCIR
jgi:hypothetical protein